MGNRGKAQCFDCGAITEDWFELAPQVTSSGAAPEVFSPSGKIACRACFTRASGYAPATPAEVYQSTTDAWIRYWHRLRECVEFQKPRESEVPQYARGFLEMKRNILRLLAYSPEAFMRFFDAPENADLKWPIPPVADLFEEE